MHKGHEREERDKQRAKDEVDRRNGVAPSPGSRTGSKPWERKSAISAANATRQATPADRKKQLEQLAEMGIAVPEEFRKDMAMAGDWQVTSQRVIYDEVKEEGDVQDVKPGKLNIGVRKRKFEGQEEEEQAIEKVVRTNWGSATRSYPGNMGDGDDLDALLQATKAEKLRHNESETPGSSTAMPPTRNSPPQVDPHPALPAIKQEPSADEADIAAKVPDAATTAVKSAPVKQEDVPDAGVVFKKRKNKPLRQK